MNRFAIYIVLCLLTGWSTALAQEKDIPFDKKIFNEDKLGFEAAVKEIRTGDSYFFDGKDELIEEALSHYLKAQEFNPHSSMLNYKIGVCYLYSYNKLQSLSHFQFVEKVNPEIDPELDFYLGQSYQLWGEFEKAIGYYEKYKLTLDPNDTEQLFYLDKKIKESKTGIQLMENPVRVWIDNLGDSINSKYSEFSPVISADNKVLFYTARRPDSYGGKTDNTGKYFEDIYYSRREFAEEWQAAKNIGEPINTISHDATVGIAPDGRSLFTYQGISAKDGDILITRQLDDGTWEKPESIGNGINSKHHESSASISFDEQTLFFVSNKPGGFGQHDIYIAHWNEKSEKWGDVENLGDVINTKFEEKGVFYHNDSKTLYFSSDGHDNMGGLDVFKTVYNEETEVWSKPENLGHPINTPDDDIYFVVTGNSRYAYYSSWRPDGFGEKDIYKITFLGAPKKPEVMELSNEILAFTHARNELPSINKTKKKFLLSGQLKVDGEPVPGEITVRDVKTNEVITQLETLPDGSYATLLEPDQEVEVSASADGFQFAKKTLMTDLDMTAYQDLDFELVSDENTLVEATENSDKNASFTSKSDKAEQTGVVTEIKDETTKNDSKDVGDPAEDATSTTDTDSNNLTENGETKTENEDSKSGTVTDNKDEIVDVKEESKTTSDNSDSNSGTISNRSDDKEKHTQIKQETAETKETHSNLKSEEKDSETANNNVVNKVDQSNTLKNLYFKFDEAQLNHVAFNSYPQKELDALTKMMKANPMMVIELGGHTDQRGSAEYNKALSLKRAEVAKNYLVAKGINSDRIKTVGYGETLPEIDLATIRQMGSNREKEIAYQKNRRTVVKVLKQ